MRVGEGRGACRHDDNAVRIKRRGYVVFPGTWYAFIAFLFAWRFNFNVFSFL